MVIAKRQRDKRGRFLKQPKPPPLDPALVKQLGQGRPTVIARYLTGGRWVWVVPLDKE